MKLSSKVAMTSHAHQCELTLVNIQTRLSVNSSWFMNIGSILDIVVKVPSSTNQATWCFSMVMFHIVPVTWTSSLGRSMSRCLLDSIMLKTLFARLTKTSSAPD